MSGIMEEAEAFYASGLVPGPDKSVCKKHVLESAVQSFVKKQGSRGSCDYCNRITSVVPLEDLMKFLMDTVRYFYTDPVEFASYSSADGGYQVPEYTAWEILHEELQLEIENSDLFEDMANCIDYERTSADEKAMYDEGHYERPAFWARFCYLVKHQVRYLFQRHNDIMNFRFGEPLAILQEVEKMTRRYSLVTKVPAGSHVFRGRQHSSKEIISTAEQMCAPKAQYCRNPNRMSPAGISMFYCAFDIETTKKETVDKSLKDSKFTSVCFELKKDIEVIDLSKLPKPPSKFDAAKRNKFEDLTFLQSFVNDLAKPVSRDGMVHIDYVPTQIVIEYFRYMLKKR